MTRQNIPRKRVDETPPNTPSARKLRLSPYEYELANPLNPAISTCRGDCASGIPERKACIIHPLDPLTRRFRIKNGQPSPYSRDTFSLRNRRVGALPSITMGSRYSARSPDGSTVASSLQVTRSSVLSTLNVTSVAAVFTGHSSTRRHSPFSSLTASLVTLPQGLFGSSPAAYFIRLVMPSPAGQASGTVWSSGVPSAKWSFFHWSYGEGVRVQASTRALFPAVFSCFREKEPSLFQASALAAS